MKSVSAIKAKFNRFNLKSSFTKIFEQLNENEQYILSINIKLIEEEEIIICFCPNQCYWWVLTNFRIIINDNHRTNYVLLSDIKNIDMKDIFNDRVDKFTCKILNFNMKNEENVDLSVEFNTWHAMYNIFKFVINTKTAK